MRESVQEVIVYLHGREKELRNIVAEAVHCAIMEILSPVVERSVTIALITTRELVLKDFALDSNE
jgi:CCR4-NOT transcription complex subunit 1